MDHIAVAKVSSTEPDIEPVCDARDISAVVHYKE